MTDVLRAELETALGSSYEIVRELTGGGMSRVFVASELALGRKVVVKVLPPDLAAGVNRDRFQREIHLSAQLQHPHIVPLLSAGEQGRLLWYTMPFIEGESLRAEIDRRGRLPVREVVRIIGDVAEALAFAHSRGVIHRDIKPGNVLLQGGHAMVTDFGVAKALSAALPSGAGTSTGMAIGTPTYMAPEQLASDPSADHRVDIYALGLLAYELLTGASPFESPSPRETMAAQLTRMPAPLDSSNPEVTPALARIVTSCLQKDPDRRPASAEALLGELEALPSGAVEARPPAGRRVRNLALAGAALVVALVVLRFRSDASVPAEPEDSSAAADPTPEPDSTPVREVTVPLSREDSLEIARAVQSRQGSRDQPALTQASMDSLRLQLERAMAESLSRAMSELQRQGTRTRGTNLLGRDSARWLVDLPRAPTTVFVNPPRPDQPPPPPPGPPVAIVFPVRMAGSADQQTILALGPARDSLLQIVRSVEGLQVIDVDSLTRLMNQRGSEVAVRLRNSVQVIGMFIPRGDSLVFRVDLRPPGWPVRGRVVQVESIVVPRNQPLAAIESVASKLEYFLGRAVNPQP